MITQILIASCGYWRELPWRPGFCDDEENDSGYDHDDNDEDHDNHDFEYPDFDVRSGQSRTFATLV